MSAPPFCYPPEEHRSHELHVLATRDGPLVAAQWVMTPSVMLWRIVPNGPWFQPNEPQGHTYVRPIFLNEHKSHEVELKAERERADKLAAENQRLHDVIRVKREEYEENRRRFSDLHQQCVSLRQQLNLAMKPNPELKLRMKRAVGKTASVDENGYIAQKDQILHELYDEFFFLPEDGE